MHKKDVLRAGHVRTNQGEIATGSVCHRMEELILVMKGYLATSTVRDCGYFRAQTKLEVSLPRARAERSPKNRLEIQPTRHLLAPSGYPLLLLGNAVRPSVHNAPPDYSGESDVPRPHPPHPQLMQLLVVDPFQRLQAAMHAIVKKVSTKKQKKLGLWGRGCGTC